MIVSQIVFLYIFIFHVINHAFSQFYILFWLENWFNFFQEHNLKQKIGYYIIYLFIVDPVYIILKNLGFRFKLIVNLLKVMKMSGNIIYFSHCQGNVRNFEVKSLHILSILAI